MKRHFWVYLVFVAFVAGTINGYDSLKPPLAYDDEAVSIEFKNTPEGDSHSDSVTAPPHNPTSFSNRAVVVDISSTSSYACLTFNPRLSQGPPAAKV